MSIDPKYYPDEFHVFLLPSRGSEDERLQKVLLRSIFVMTADALAMRPWNKNLRIPSITTTQVIRKPYESGQFIREVFVNWHKNDHARWAYGGKYDSTFNETQWSLRYITYAQNIGSEFSRLICREIPIGFRMGGAHVRVLPSSQLKDVHAEWAAARKNIVDAQSIITRLTLKKIPALRSTARLAV